MRRRAHRLQVTQTRGQHLGGGLPFFRGLGTGGQQQARFQPCEPGRHHQPVSGELQFDFPRALNYREKLIDQREDGDFAEIEFLAARQFQQQVERPLEPVEMQHQPARCQRVRWRHDFRH